MRQPQSRRHSKTALLLGVFLAASTLLATLPTAQVKAAETETATKTDTEQITDSDHATKPTVDAPDTFNTITNDAFYTDTEGNNIYSQGGGIFDFTDPKTGVAKHYWYGVHYKEAETYAANPTAALPTNNFNSIDVYSSTDLVNWNNEGQALDYDQANAFSSDFGGRNVAWVGRMGVAYIASLNKYALLVQNEMPTDDTGKNFNKEVLIATSDSPAGPFTADRRINMKDYNLGTTNTGDQSVFQDDDGTGYLVYSYGSGRSSMWIAQIGEKNGKVDLLNPTKIYSGRGREGNAMFKANGKYYAAASDLFGWDSSRVHYLVADNVYGPYTPTNSMQIMDGSREDFAHITQTGFYYTVKGSEQETVIHMGDRWADFAGNGLGYNQWNPIIFDTDETPHFVSMNQWNLNEATGQWNVGTGNNYVLNGSFEADRVAIGANGYSDKDGKNIPDLAGWTRTNPEAIYNAPDKANRVGDYNLEFHFDAAFSSSIDQTIAPTEYALPDGEYTLTAQHLSTRDLADAKLYADSGDDHFEVSLGTSTKGKWVATPLTVQVTSGRVDIGVSVNGNAGDLLRVDDISLVLVKAKVPVDKTQLNSLIDAAQSLTETKYTEDSWKTLQTVLAAATTISADDNATQEQVDQAAVDLQQALDNLVVVEEEPDPDTVDHTKLQELVTKAQEKKAEDYESQSWDIFANTLEDVVSILNDDAATQEQVDAATKKLQTAMDALVPLDDDSSDDNNTGGSGDGDDSDNNNGDSNNDDSDNSGNTGELPSTGSAISSVMIVAVVLSVLFVGFAILRKSRNS